MSPRPRYAIRLIVQLAGFLGALSIALTTAGCGLPFVGQDPPAQPSIEQATGSVPGFVGEGSPWIHETWGDDLPPLVAKLRLNSPHDGLSLYLSDWAPPVRCWLQFIAEADGSGGAVYKRNVCGVLPKGDPAADDPIFISQYGPEDSAPTRITVGTVDSSFEELRLTFLECGSRSYVLDGPTVPSKPTRRVFTLDQGDCEWEKAEALRGGAVVAKVDNLNAGFRD